MEGARQARRSRGEDQCGFDGGGRSQFHAHAPSHRLRSRPVDLPLAASQLAGTSLRFACQMAWKLESVHSPRGIWGAGPGSRRATTALQRPWGHAGSTGCLYSHFVALCSGGGSRTNALTESRGSHFAGRSEIIGARAAGCQCNWLLGTLWSSPLGLWMLRHWLCGPPFSPLASSRLRILT